MMTVLTCPVCQGSMREVNRNGIVIDTCVQCRGVWLDRGELEKLTSAVREEFHPPHDPRGASYDDDDRRRNHRPPDEGAYRYGYAKPYRKKSKLEKIMDIFD